MSSEEMSAMSEQVRYRPVLSAGDKVLFNRKYGYIEGTVVEVVVDTSSRWEPRSEFYVFYKVRPSNPFRATRWMRGEDVKGLLAKEVTND